MNTLTILSLTAYRLKLVRSPLRTFKLWYSKLLLALIWLLSCATTVISLSYKSGTKWDQRGAKCFSTVYENKEASLVFRVVWGGVIVVPLVSITVINVVLCYIAVRSSRTGDTTNFRALKTVCLLSGAFTVSWFPYLIYLMWKGASDTVPWEMTSVALHCIQLNTFCNPILYTLTNRRFARFVSGILGKCLGSRLWASEDQSRMMALTTCKVSTPSTLKRRSMAKKAAVEVGPDLTMEAISRDLELE